MPKFNVQEQQTITQNAPATAAAFGASTGQALAQAGDAVSQVGDAVAQIEFRSKQRSDVIDRVRQQNAFDEAATALRQETMDTMDMADPATVGVYKEGLRKKIDEIVGSHKGLPGSREQLRASLEQSFGQYSQQITEDQIRSQQFLILDSVTNSQNSLSDIATRSPDVLEDALAEYDERINELSPALTKEQESEYRRKGKESILTGAIGSYLQQGDYETASQLMNVESYAKVLSPATTRKFRMDVAKLGAEARAKEQAYLDKVSRYTLLMKRNPTPEELARIKLLPPKKDMTTADKIAEYELVSQKQAPQSVIDDMYNLDAGSSFGNSLRGRALETINSNLTSYSQGLLNKQEAIEFQSAVFEAYGSKEYTDPVTGERKKVQASMPPAVRQALESGTSVYGPVDMGGIDTTQPSGAEPMDPLEGPSLWDMALEVSGPGTAAERAIFGLTGYGSAEPQTAAFAARTLQENIVRGIRPEGKIANQYRQELMNLVDIAPKVFENDTAYRRKLVDIDVELRNRLTELRRIVDGEVEATTVQERRDATTLANNIQHALARLRVPRPKTPEEARALPEGTVFVTPNGDILKAPSRTGGRRAE